MAMTYNNRINRQAEAMYGKATDATATATGSYAQTCSYCKAQKFNTEVVRNHNDEQYGNFPKRICQDCKAESEQSEPLFECGGCERKVNVVEGAFCSDCFSRGARATARW